MRSHPSGSSFTEPAQLAVKNKKNKAFNNSIDAIARFYYIVANMNKIFDSIINTIGQTPLVRLNNIPTHTSKVYLKLENTNPGFSIKDRIALNMIDRAEKDGLLKEGTKIIEPTSGNTGLGIALIAAAREYDAIIILPDSMSIERQKLLKHLGAEIITTPAEAGMAGSIKKAEEIKKENANSIILSQFDNPANPEAHYKTTGPEIWEATEGGIDILIAGIGTGGTISGTGKYLKEKKPSIKIIGAEPESSAVLNGASPGRHRIQGIGAGFIPGNLNRTLLDEVITVKDQDAIKHSRILAQKEGILAGISSGANLYAALSVASRDENRHKTIVTFVCDTAERYISTPLFND